jgi:hypothetical protein
MRRIGLLQLGLLSFVLASDMTEWRWFADDNDSPATSEKQTQFDAFPMAYQNRTQVVDQIEIPVTICYGFESSGPAVFSSHFTHPLEAHPGSFPDVPLTYSHMSLQL